MYQPFLWRVFRYSLLPFFSIVYNLLHLCSICIIYYVIWLEEILRWLLWLMAYMQSLIHYSFCSFISETRWSLEDQTKCGNAVCKFAFTFLSCCYGSKWLSGFRWGRVSSILNLIFWCSNLEKHASPVLKKMKKKKISHWFSRMIHFILIAKSFLSGICLLLKSCFIGFKIKLFF